MKETPSFAVQQLENMVHRFGNPVVVDQRVYDIMRKKMGDAWCSTYLVVNELVPKGKDCAE